jgi:uncharacterized membrane protein
MVTKLFGDRLRAWSIVLAGVGLLDSLYLTWIKLADQTVVCSNIGDCESVNNSPYSEIAGIPIAALGAGAYLCLLALSYLEIRMPGRRELWLMASFGIALAGTLYSAYLTYIELAVLRAVCPYCVLSAAAITMILIFVILRLRSSTGEDLTMQEV